MSGRRIGNYLIGDYLGGGGFGSVFKAEDLSAPGRIVAIKELHKKHTRSAVIKQRFFQEAIAMAKLDHANLPRLFTFGEDNGSYYLVMEFLSGRLLTDEIHDQQKLAPERAVDILIQVLDAVSYAHRNGIIHRDLKPDNIMLTGEALAPKVKVLDFGIARMVGGENLTMAGEGFGTPTYMSPERIAGDNAPDNRSDIYSLGIILYEMLSGKPPFYSSSTDPLVYWSEMRSMHESQTLPSLTEFGIAPEIEQIIHRATAKTKAERYATADEMLAALRALAESGTLAASSVASPASQLFITTVPADAEVYVDNESRGLSDGATGKLRIDALAPGPHSVRVVKSGYTDYRISVVLEAGKRVDLQVPLAARSTSAIPRPDAKTYPSDAETVRMASGEEVATAMLLLEGIPAGSQVFVGSKAMGLAGEDGKATLQLKPGVHELQVTTPDGSVGKQFVTLTHQDAGGLKTMAMPVAPNTGSSPATITHSTVGEPSPAKKRLAMAAAAVLLLALVGSAYFVMRKPAPTPVASVSVAPSGAEASTPPGAEAAGETVPANDTTEAERAAIAREREELDRERRELEKKKQAMKEGAAEKETPQKEKTPVVTPPPPPPPGGSTPETPQTDNETGCVGVHVVGPDGQSVPRAKVMFITNGGVESRRTGPEGLCGACGFQVGSTISVFVNGPGLLPTSRKVVVRAGKTGVEMKLAETPQFQPGRRPGYNPPDGEGDIPRIPRPKRFRRGDRSPSQN